MKLRCALLFLLPLAALSIAATPPDRSAELRKTAAPVWKAYTSDHITELMKDRKFVHMVFRHDPRAVRYTVTGDRGTVSAAGTVLATAPCDTRKTAAAAPWTIRRRATLTLSFTWRDGAWRPGAVAWKDGEAR